MTRKQVMKKDILRAIITTAIRAESEVRKANGDDPLTAHNICERAANLRAALADLYNVTAHEYHCIVSNVLVDFLVPDIDY